MAQGKGQHVQDSVSLLSLVLGGLYHETQLRPLPNTRFATGSLLSVALLLPGW